MKFPQLTHKEIIDNFNSSVSKTLEDKLKEVNQMELERIEYLKERYRLEQGLKIK